MIFLNLILIAFSAIGPMLANVRWLDYSHIPAAVFPYTVIAGILAGCGLFLVPWWLAIIDAAEGNRRVFGLKVVSVHLWSQFLDLFSNADSHHIVESTES